MKSYLISFLCLEISRGTSQSRMGAFNFPMWNLFFFLLKCSTVCDCWYILYFFRGGQHIPVYVKWNCSFAVVEIALIFQLALVIRCLLFLTLCMHGPDVSKKEGSPQESSGFPLAVCGVCGASWYLTRLPAVTMSCVFSTWDALCVRRVGRAAALHNLGEEHLLALLVQMVLHITAVQTKPPVACMCRTVFIVMYRTKPNQKMPSAL
jgi:hypothetical protein